jgi:carbonic anhydrase
MRSSFGLSRRAVLGCACCAGVVATMARLPLAWAAGTHEASGISPDEALALLKEGNAEFVADEPFRAARGPKRRLETSKQQKPFAVLVGCSDSRVAPELLFSRGLGELFVIRVAGNTVDLAALGTIQYAVGHLGAPLIVVLGHERCGAVAAACDLVEKHAELPGSIGDVVAPIVPAVLKAKEQKGDLLDNAVSENVRHVVRRLRHSGPMLELPLADGRLKIVGARYDLDDGIVDFTIEA